MIPMSARRSWPTSSGRVSYYVCIVRICMHIRPLDAYTQNVLHTCMYTYIYTYISPMEIPDSEGDVSKRSDTVSMFFGCIHGECITHVYVYIHIYTHTSDGDPRLERGRVEAQ